MERHISRIVRISRECDEGQRQRDTEIVKLLSQAGIVTCGAYMATSALVLRKAGLDALDMDRVMNCIAENVAPAPISASAMMGANSQVSILSSSSSSSYMDTEVGNIFSAGHVTELCGPNLVGKTLLCVDLTVRCIINSLLRRKQQHVDVAAGTKAETAGPTIALYVDIKKKLNSKSGLQENVTKIVEDCASRRHHHQEAGGAGAGAAAGAAAGDTHTTLPTIEVEEVIPCFQIVEMDNRGAKGLLAWLRSEELQMELSTSNVACIVIDSLTALLPTNNKGSSSSGSSSSSADEEFAVELSYLLRRIAEACACPVVITTAAPQGQYVHCEELCHGPYQVRDVWRTSLALAPTLQHCVQARCLMLYDYHSNCKNPTVPPPLYRSGRSSGGYNYPPDGGSSSGRNSSSSSSDYHDGDNENDGDNDNDNDNEGRRCLLLDKPISRGQQRIAFHLRAMRAMYADHH